MGLHGRQGVGREALTGLRCSRERRTSTDSTTIGAAPLAQRRHAKADLADAVVQVFAEAAGLDDAGRSWLVAETTRTSTGIGRGRRRARHALLQEAQQLGLQRERHVADLVEEQRAAVGGLELARGLLGGAGEGARLVAEQLAFEQLLGNGRAVDGDERLLARGLA